jgi:HAD superfamily hydrolase (TIGR01450 family)
MDDLASTPPRATRFAGYVIDLDGTLTLAQGLTRGARELIARVRDAYVVVSNDSSHTPSGLADELADLGLPVPPTRIVLAGAATIDLIADEMPGARVMLFASPALSALAVAAGLELVDERPDVVVLARDESFTYAKLCRAANAIRRGAGLVVTNLDLTHPGHGRDVVPETGALLAALRACCSDVPYRVVGKPEPRLFIEALRRLGTPPESTLVIGDNPATDGRGAKKLGMPFLLVRDGDAKAAAAALDAARFDLG